MFAERAVARARCEAPRVRGYLSPPGDAGDGVCGGGDGVRGVLRGAGGRGVPGAAGGGAGRGAAVPERVHDDLPAERGVCDGAVGAGVRGRGVDGVRAGELGAGGIVTCGARVLADDAHADVSFLFQRGMRGGVPDGRDGAGAAQLPAAALRGRGVRAQDLGAAGDRGLCVHPPDHRGARVRAGGAGRAGAARAGGVPGGGGGVRVRDVPVPGVLADAAHAGGGGVRVGAGGLRAADAVVRGAAVLQNV